MSWYVIKSSIKPFKCLTYNYFRLQIYTPVLQTTFIMDTETLESFLRRLDINVSIEVFQNEGIDLDWLKSLSKDDLEKNLKELKLTLVNRWKICTEIKSLKSRKLSILLYLTKLCQLHVVTFDNIY